MQVENALQPDGDQVKTFTSKPTEGPIVMVNLLKFREKAAYEDGRESDLSGREAYQLYANEMRKLVEGGGGRFLFAGDVQSLLLGKVEDLWDLVGIVEYPAPAAMMKIATSPEFREIEVHRIAGLEGQLNITTRNSAEPE